MLVCIYRIYVCKCGYTCMYCMVYMCVYVYLCICLPICVCLHVTVLRTPSCDPNLITGDMDPSQICACYGPDTVAI